MRRLSEANLQAAVQIETTSYPEDEAASPENMRFRRANAGAFFLEATRKSVSGRGKRKASLAAFNEPRELLAFHVRLRCYHGITRSKAMFGLRDRFMTQSVSEEHKRRLGVRRRPCHPAPLQVGRKDERCIYMVWLVPLEGSRRHLQFRGQSETNSRRVQPALK